MFYAQNHIEPDILTALHVAKADGTLCCDIGARDGEYFSNSAYLIKECGWSAVLVEADRPYMSQCRIFHAGNDKVRFVEQWVTAENINDVVPIDATFLSIDVDGNDYHLFKALACKPPVVIIEYNSRKSGIGAIHPYTPEFRRPKETHWYGCSKEALLELAAREGYVQFKDIGEPNVLLVAAERMQNIGERA